MRSQSRGAKLHFPPGAVKLVGIACIAPRICGTLGPLQINSGAAQPLALGSPPASRRSAMVGGLGGRSDAHIAFSCTVVSKSQPGVPFKMLWSRSPACGGPPKALLQQRGDLSSPSRCRQRLSHERSNGSSCRNTLPPPEVLAIRVLHPFVHSASIEEVCHVLVDLNSPSTARVGNGGCPGPRPSEHSS